MNQRDHDMIVRAAFGESEHGEQAFVDEMLRRDAEAKTLYDEFADIKVGLRQMDDVPACQLSTERLRQAILDQGVQPMRRAQPARYTWGFGLAAAACLALTFVMVRQQANVVPDRGYPQPLAANVGEPPTSPDNTLPVTPSEPDRSVSAPPVVAEVLPSEPTPTLGTVVASGAMNAKVSHGRRVRKVEVVPQAPAFSGESLKDGNAAGTMALTTSTNTAARDNNANRTVAMDSATFDAAVPEGPVVVVQPQTDPRTGAALAFESNHASDFVFGG